MLQEKRKTIQQIVDDQVKQWLISISEKKKKEPVNDHHKGHPCIAISRERGSGGWMIGKTITEKLKYKLFDSAILNEMARNLKISRQVLDTVDEQVQTRMEIWINRLFRNRYIEPTDFQHHLVQTILSIAEHGNAVFIGRAAHVIIPRESCLSLRFVAPIETRIANICETLELAEDKARLDVIQKDRSREAFLQQEFGTNSSELTAFDIIINTHYFNCEELAEFIINCYRHRFDL